MRLRKHQQAFADRIEEIKAEPTLLREVIVAAVTPGGGKTALEIQTTRLVDAGLIDAVCIVTPRASLQDQATRDFLDEDQRQLFAHSHCINAATNDHDPCRGTSGYATTYQAVGLDSGGINAYELISKKYALILDEAHHVQRGGKWHRALQTLVDHAVCVILMTGTLYRGDRKPIAFMPYTESEDGMVIDFDSADHYFIHYSRREALAEHAIIPIEFCQLDGEATWLDENGVQVHVPSLAAEEDETGRALFTALHTEFAIALLDATLQHFLPYKEQHPRAKLLVVAPTIAQARRFKDYLLGQKVPTAIAASDDSAAALEAMHEFRYGGIDVLVSVAMASEGFNVPQVTHIACLTHVRSRPWLEQLFARATRYDRAAGTYHEQRAYIWVPDDALLNGLIAEIRREQAMTVVDPDENDGRTAGVGGGRLPGDIVPMQSGVTRSRHRELDGDGELSYAQTLGIERWMARANIAGMSVIQVANVLAKAGVTIVEASNDPDGGVPLTPADQMTTLRRTIENHVRLYEYQNGIEPGTTNRALKQHFGKGRPDMTLQELIEQWTYVQRRHPVGGKQEAS